MPRSRWPLLAVTAVLAIAALTLTAAALRGSGAVTIELRVWQDVDDPLTHYVSARPEGGSWQTLGTVPLPLDDGLSRSGRFRYGDLALDVPLELEGEACRFGETLERSRAATFRLNTDYQAGGTAFHIGGGEFVTAGHIIEQARRPLTLTLTNHTHELADVQLVGYRRDESGDVALLRSEGVAADVPALEWGELADAQQVALLGYPARVFLGDVPRAQIRIGEADPAVVLGVDPSTFWPRIPSFLGQSGGPVVDACGRVLGVNLGFFDDEHSVVTSRPLVGALLDEIRAEAER